MRPSSHLATLLLLAFSPTVLAQGDDRTASLAKTLKAGTIPTQRAQAARVLGESEDPEAMEPLCAGLADALPEVRTASARALEALEEPDAVACLEARPEDEDAQAKQAVASALGKLRALQARPAKFYVMLPPLKDTTGSLSPALMKLTEARMRRALRREGAALAPEKETEAQAREVLRERKLVGFRLVTEVRAVPPEGLKLSVLGLRYPGKQLIGNISVQATDAEPGALLAALVPSAIEESAASFKWKK